MRIVGAGLEHGEGEAFVRVEGGFGLECAGDAFEPTVLVEEIEPGGFRVGEALDEPLFLGEAFDEEDMRKRLRLEVGE